MMEGSLLSRTKGERSKGSIMTDRMKDGEGPDEGLRGTRSHNRTHCPQQRRGPGSACRIGGFGAPPFVPWQAVGQFDRGPPVFRRASRRGAPAEERGDEHIV